KQRGWGSIPSPTSRTSFLAYLPIPQISSRNCCPTSGSRHTPLHAARGPRERADQGANGSRTVRALHGARLTSLRKKTEQSAPLVTLHPEIQAESGAGLMASAHHVGASHHLRALFEVGTVVGLSDGQLLDRFVSRREEAAFTALIERHGPMVQRVCGEVLGDYHDAQDAFQATFLVLARHAGSIRHRDSLASWLYGVALRVSAGAWAAAGRRPGDERERAAPRAAPGSRGGRGPRRRAALGQRAS